VSVGNVVHVMLVVGVYQCAGGICTSRLLRWRRRSYRIIHVHWAWLHLCTEWRRQHQLNIPGSLHAVVTTVNVGGGGIFCLKSHSLHLMHWWWYSLPVNCFSLP